MALTSRLSEILKQSVRAVSFAARFGRRQLVLNFVLMFASATIGALGVASIGPFLAVASSDLPNTAIDRAPIIGAWLSSLTRRNAILAMGAFSLATILLSNLVTWLTERERLRYGYGMIHALRRELMENYCNQVYGYFLQTNSSLMLKQVVYDSYVFVNGVLVPSLEIIARAVSLLFVLVLLLLIDVRITILISIAFGCAYLGTLYFIGRRIRRIGVVLDGANHEILHSAQTFFGAIKVIMLHGKLQSFGHRLLQASQVATNASRDAALAGAIPRYLLEPIALGLLVATIVVATIQSHSLSQVLPAISIFMFAGYRILPSMQSIYGQAVNVVASIYSVNEIAKFARERGPMWRDDEMPRQFLHSIKLEAVSFRYPGARHPAIQSLTCEIKKYSKTGIVGPTGCGKSTLVDVILGLQLPTSGRILIDGAPLDRATVNSWQRAIGYVPQDIFLLDDTIAANIAFGVPKCLRDAARLRQAATAAQIDKFILEDLPKGFDTMIGDRGVRLSGGQRQRVGIARALYHDPQILVLDEATSAVDAHTEAEIMNSIYAMQSALTIIIVSHRRGPLDRCDQIIDMAQIRE